MRLYWRWLGFVPEGRKVEEVQAEAGTLRQEAESSLEGRKPEKKPPPVKPPVRRKRGKLSNKEYKEMKSKHKDISWLLTPLPIARRDG